MAVSPRCSRQKPWDIPYEAMRYCRGGAYGLLASGEPGAHWLTLGAVEPDESVTSLSCLASLDRGVPAVVYVPAEDFDLVAVRSGEQPPLVTTEGARAERALAPPEGGGGA